MESNIKEYAEIALSLGTYEERVRLYQAELALKKQQIIEKLKALGLTEDEIGALSR
jgi:DNA-binding transcriptional MerR regulator